MESFVAKLYEQNRWANLLLLDACKDLTEAQLDDASIQGTYGSIRQTLLHLASAEGRYVWRLKGSPAPEPPREEKGFPGFDALRARLDESGHALMKLALSTPGDMPLSASFEGTDYSYVADLVKVQAINHGTEHRAQISTTLTQLGVKPPEMDGWSFGYEGGLMKTTESKGS